MQSVTLAFIVDASSFPLYKKRIFTLNDAGIRRALSRFKVLYNHSPRNMDNKYPEGSLVYAIAAPEERMVIKRYIDRRYYCRQQKDAAQKERVFFERELTNDPNFGKVQ
jgi:hypothetical protein